jgi:hypothetical protein
MSHNTPGVLSQGFSIWDFQHDYLDETSLDCDMDTTYGMGAPMKVAIIGAGRNRNGIGEFIAKYLHTKNAVVSCVLGTTKSSSSSAATNLVKYGIQAEAYTVFSEMMKSSKPDTVVIASPTPTHRGYIEKCLATGVHIFCEKPLVSPELGGMPDLIEGFFRQAQERSVVMTMNSQWPFSLPFYEELCGKIDPSHLEKFSIRLSPTSSGVEMIPDALPHALSILYTVAGSGEIKALSFKGHGDSMLIRFSYLNRYGTCDVSVELVRESIQPRTFSFGFNGRIVHRLIDPELYTIYLTYRGKTLNIPDPLELSVCDFIEAVRSGGEPAVGRRHIMETSSLLQNIFTAYKHA